MLVERPGAVDGDAVLVGNEVSCLEIPNGSGLPMAHGPAATTAPLLRGS